ncbi:MAG: PepSY domain-containing protein, partial [Bacteroidota bacterium]
LIPLTNGMVYNNWIWNTYKNHQIEIFTIDVLWICLSVIGLFIYFKIKPSIKEKSAFTKHPIDFKNRHILLAEEAKQHIENLSENQQIEDKNYIPMRTKIVILWIFLGIGWIIHHMYGLFNIYYNETLVLEGATGEAPMIHHIYRILFEGICLFFGLLTIEVSKKWFIITSLIWAGIAGLYNVYHFVVAIIFESENISEIFMLLLMTIASIFLVRNLYKWKTL